ncbi:SDR family NAD(P)-dependent oxidoreductase [uncultured Friedmanniella sp.]|uniref:SDR family NAD(P)-dependent oxidoreductase n=1 Tax=uncultured Friedmanniella sp. TaxID=335381 RepID=UPI0035CAA014
MNPPAAPGPPPRLLEGRVAVVTGAGRGIGRAIAAALAAHGAQVALADVDLVGVSAAAEDIGETTGTAALALELDVTRPDSVRAGADLVESTFGVADVVVANAGILVFKPALEITPAEFARCLEVNLTGAFTTVREFAGRLVAAGRPGSVVLTSSLFGVRGGAGNAAYAASKFGMVGLAESMAADLAPAGIRVNAVCPGQIDSEMLQQLFRDRAEQDGTEPTEEQARFEQRIPWGRLGTGADVADAFVYLASDLSRYVTGQKLVVDGGWSVG